ncbi:MAG TPA: SDR family oxidoreductase [Phototrophicaceae bacterium]|nr:SDR family oxidoreductase [Phototrophicaceae bacterium]
MSSVFPLFGITGATGYVGGRVARRLAAQGVRQRLVVRDVSRAPQLSNASVAYASAYGDKAAMTQALRGVQILFLVSGDLAPGRENEHLAAIDAALTAGVERIVYLSFLSAANSATFTLAREHFHSEEHMRASGVRFTFLRSSLYADEAPTWFGADGVIRGPAGDGRVSWVLRDDIVDAVVAVLTSDDHDGKIYNNTGREALTLMETAALMSEFSGRRCVYHQETLDEARAWRRATGASDVEVEAWVSSYTAIATGEMSLISDDLARVSGHPQQTLRDYLRQNPDSYKHLRTDHS